MTTRLTFCSATASTEARRRRIRMAPLASLRDVASRRGSGSGAGSSTGNPAATESGQPGSRVTWSSGPPRAGCGGEDFARRDRERARLRAALPSRKRRALVAGGFRGKGRGCRCVLRPLFEAPLVVSSTGAGGWAERASRPRGAVQVCGRPFDRAVDRRVDHTASCPWPGTTIRVCDIVRGVSRMSLQVARSTKLTENSTCCIVAPPVGPALMSRSPA